MGINEFFEFVLDAPPANKRWPWGAVNVPLRRVYLRVWGDTGSYDKVNQRMLVLSRDTGKSKHAFNERRRHLALMTDGYKTFGVVCTRSNNSGPNDAKIESFDTDVLLRLGDLSSESDGRVFAKVVATIPVADLLKVPTVVDDIKSLLSDSSLQTTMRKALIDARLGQGMFRQNLIKRFKGVCAVTGCSIHAMLRASHIKPWSASTNEERLDADNGLLLSANIDSLFDRGFISFTSEGGIILSQQLNENQLRRFGAYGHLGSKPNRAQAMYLEFHRKNIFVDAGET
jgi:HNH endonuclease